MVFGCRWTSCLCCRSSRDDENVEEASDDDSEIYMIRRRRAERQQQRSTAREEYISNILITKQVSTKKARSADDDDDHFLIGGDRAIPNCAICLIDYENGDKVSFSHNPKCQHHFHRPCILEWLKDHDECPCCRSNYLAFSDDGGDGDNHTTGDVLPESDPTEHPQQLDEDYLARLYQTGPYESAEPAGQNGVHNRDDEPWEVQFERTLERLRSQVDERVQIAQRQVRELRENRRNRRQESDGGGGGGDDGGVAFEDRVERWRIERSVQQVRSQLSRLRQAADRELRNRSTRNNNGDAATGTRNQHGEARWEDAVQVVRTRLSDIANSESAGRLRENTVPAMQNFMRLVSQRRSGT